MDTITDRCATVSVVAKSHKRRTWLLQQSSHAPHDTNSSLSPRRWASHRSASSNLLRDSLSVVSNRYHSNTDAYRGFNRRLWQSPLSASSFDKTDSRLSGKNGFPAIKSAQNVIASLCAKAFAVKQAHLSLQPPFPQKEDHQSKNESSLTTKFLHNNFK